MSIREFTLIRFLVDTTLTLNTIVHFYSTRVTYFSTCGGHKSKVKNLAAVGIE